MNPPPSEPGLEEAIAPMSGLIASLPDALLVLNTEGQIVQANPEAEELFGFNQQEFLNISMTALFTPLAEEDSFNIRDAFLPGAKFPDTNFRQISTQKSGTVFIADVVLSELIVNGFRSILVRVLDITKQVETEKALAKLTLTLDEKIQDVRLREARYSTLFHSIDDGVCIIEMLFNEAGEPIDYRFIEINEGFVKQTGFKDALGKTIKELAPNHEQTWLDLYGRIALGGEAVRFQNYAARLGRWYDVYACKTGRPEEHQLGLFFTDITNKRQMELDLREAKEKAEQANRAKSEFLSRMSHELRTPMNAVLGFAQILDLQYDDPEIKQSAHAILKGGKHLLGMINEVLDLSRIETGNFAISLEPVSVLEILLQTVSLLKPTALESNVQITIEEEHCQHLYVNADRQRLLQVVINLLGNGIKYNRAGGYVAVSCSEPSDGLCRIEFSDTGRGISPEQQKLLFQPFQRFGDSGIEGTGLGLALSEGLMRLMGGELGLLKSSPEGSTFYIDLISVNPAHQGHALEVMDDTLTSAPLDRRGTVLCVEDNLSNMKLMEMVFEGFENITLLQAEGGLAGLEMAQQKRPDLILLDVHLPDIMGDEVLRQLKSDPVTVAIPVVILSADATHRQIKNLLDSGASGYLTKPLELQRLFEILETYLPTTDGP